MNSTENKFSNRRTFILAAIGAAVGLGNIWKFPYIVGEHGGGAFILVYLGAILLTGIPIFMAELYIGKRERTDVVSAFPKRTAWIGIGPFSVLSAILVLAIYSVIGGWVMDFEFQSILGNFSPSNQNVEITPPQDGGLGNQVLWTGLFYVICVIICIGGVQKGIERASKILIPVLILLILVLAIRALFMPGAGHAADFLFSPDFSQLTREAIVEAIGHAFFTLSVGFGAILTYGSYLPKGPQPLPQMAITVAAADTFIAMLMGFIIFAIGYSSVGFEPGAGPALLFETLPKLFGVTAAGYFLSIAFFTLVAFAALTSAISMLEIIVAVVQKYARLNRLWTTLLCGVFMYICSVLVIVFYHETFDFVDDFTSNFMLPAGGIFMSLYVGWRLGPSAIKDIVGPNHPVLSTGLLWVLRLVAPIAVAGVVINGMIPFG